MSQGRPWTEERREASVGKSAGESELTVNRWGEIKQGLLGNSVSKRNDKSILTTAFVEQEREHVKEIAKIMPLSLAMIQENGGWGHKDY